jgi:hypothetical protein
MCKALGLILGTEKNILGDAGLQSEAFKFTFSFGGKKPRKMNSLY